MYLSVACSLEVERIDGFGRPSKLAASDVLELGMTRRNRSGRYVSQHLPPTACEVILTASDRELDGLDAIGIEAEFLKPTGLNLLDSPFKLFSRIRENVLDLPLVLVPIPTCDRPPE